MRIFSLFSVAAGLTVGSLALFAEPVHACGGLFCSNVSPTPIDQAAERILFEVLDDGSVAATVEIKYQGDPSAFSWIVPVTGTPAFVDVAPKDLLNLLDTATRPTIIPPTPICTESEGSSNGISGCGGPFPSAPMADGALDASEGEGEGEAGNDGIDVTEYPSVGPYDDIVVVEGFDPNILMNWLNDNGYQVTEGMRPFIEQYTLEGYAFLATKLLPNADVLNMNPIRFHCPSPYPEIPLRLTAIAAEPQMGFLVFIAGPGRYAPMTYGDIQLETPHLRVAGGVSNYFALTSLRVDEEGGRAFVLERAQPSPLVQSAVDNTFIFIEDTEAELAARAELNRLFNERTFITRLYTRMDPDEMTEDPEFVPAGALEFDGVHDLSAQTVEVCGGPRGDVPNASPPCGATYCGVQDRCAPSVDGVDGCVCDDNRTARAITGPGGGLQVACASLDIDLHGGGAAACAEHECGFGVCVAVNDRPTCSCDDDAVAVIGFDQVTCVKRLGGDVFEADQVVWPLGSPDSGEEVVVSGGGCTAPRGNDVGNSLSVALLLLSPLLFQLLSRVSGRLRRRR